MGSKLVLVLNCGSSSLKFAILDAVNGDEKLSGLAECFHLPDARIKWKLDGQKETANLGNGAAHHEALNFIIHQILSQKPELSEGLIAIGHRVVHGGEKFTQSKIITDEVLQGIEDCASLAPLHNPAHIIGINAAKDAFSQLPQVAVFDTAFHQSMPSKAFMYAIPAELYRKHDIRRYGMHGTSHLYIAKEAADRLGKAVEQTNVISCHLGNGASVCAIKNGQSVDTSMGLTPLEGLVMGTRCGDLDPAIIFYLTQNLGYEIDEVNTILHKKSGLLGLSELTSDCRGIEDGYMNGHAGATLALEVFCYRLAKYIASYTVPLERLDAVIFTGGIGENSDIIRKLVLQQLVILGFKVDDEKNIAARFGNDGVITTDDSPIAMVIPTNEEWVIARDAMQLSENQ